MLRYKKNISSFIILIMILTFSNISFGEKAMPEKLIGEIDIQDFMEDDILTYDEMIETMVNDGIPVGEAVLSLADNNIRTNSVTPFELSYTTRYVEIPIKDNYTVRIAFYLTIDSAYGAYAIHKVNRVSLDRGYAGGSKEFDGSLYYNLENRTTIYYELNGDFYNYGTTTTSGGGSIGVGDTGSLKFSISHSSKHFQYVFKTGRLKYGNVRPK